MMDCSFHFSTKSDWVEQEPASDGSRPNSPTSTMDTYHDLNGFSSITNYKTSKKSSAKICKKFEEATS